MLAIRPATENDIPDILEIYNDAILNTTATFDTELKTQDEMQKWFRGHGPNHPVIVAIVKEQIAGWASLSRWSDKKAYDTTAECSFYVRKEMRQQGIGKRLLEMITLEGEKAGIYCILSRITEGNEASIHLHDAFGYRNIGIMKKAGKKFGKFLDVHLMQKVFPAS